MPRVEMEWRGYKNKATWYVAHIGENDPAINAVCEGFAKLAIHRMQGSGWDSHREVSRQASSIAGKMLEGFWEGRRAQEPALHEPFCSLLEQIWDTVDFVDIMEGYISVALENE